REASRRLYRAAAGSAWLRRPPESTGPSADSATDDGEAPAVRRGLFVDVRQPVGGGVWPRPSACRMRLRSSCVSPPDRLPMPSWFRRFWSCVGDRFTPRLLSRLCRPARLETPPPPASPQRSWPSRPLAGCALIVTITG